MPNATLICESCGNPFQGRANRRTCSNGCRRSIEYARREWERRAWTVRYLERNAYMEGRTKLQKANWLKRLEEAQAKLGPRP